MAAWAHLFLRMLSVYGRFRKGGVIGLACKRHLTHQGKVWLQLQSRRQRICFGPQNFLVLLCCLPQGSTGQGEAGLLKGLPPKTLAMPGNTVYLCSC